MNRPSPTPRKRFPIWPVLIAAVVVAGVIAIVTTSGGDDDVDVEPDAGAPAETAAVEVEGAALPQFRSTADDAAVGRAAPTLHGSTFAGTPITIPTGDGTAKAIFFVAHWCPHCQREVPRLVEWLRSHELPSNLTVEVVSTGVGESENNYPPSEWLRREGLANVPTLADDPDSTAYHAYGGGGLPFVVYLDRDGRVALRTAGEYGDDPEVYTDLFEDLAAGEEVTDPRG
jgi:cytochrome c biogenesis protein CcmG, thiol:disulfide interchange protein DsbE